MLKKKFNFVLVLLFIDSSHAENHFTSSSLILKEPIRLELAKSITKKELSEDIDYLNYALRNAYVAYDFIDKKYFSELEDRLNKLKEFDSYDATSLCDKIGDYLWSIPDGHLRALNGKKMCSILRDKEERKPNVGDNIGRGLLNKTGVPWSIHNKRILDSNVKILSITSLTMAEDEVWSGYTDAIKTLTKSERAVIIDMRGLPGGDDRRGQELTELLIGQKVLAPKGRLNERIKQAPATIALRINLWKYFMARNKSEGKEIPAYLNKHLKKDTERYKKAEENKLPLYLVQKQEQKTYKVTGYKGKIYVLIDAICGSSCESTLEALMHHPNVITVGQNTRGLRHFTTEGLIQLPNSRIIVRMATKFNEYENFLEKKGHTPNVKVEEGEDALDFVLAETLKN